jgi:hypothetical protein
MAKGKSLHNFLDDGFCANLGYSYQPYNWIESVCDEMIEDKLGEYFYFILLSETHTYDAMILYSIVTAESSEMHIQHQMIFWTFCALMPKLLPLVWYLVKLLQK